VLTQQCIAANRQYDWHYANGEDGYYAAHFYIYQDVRYNSGVKRLANIDLNLRVEIQITTQLQEVIRKFLHKIYESGRTFPSNKSKPWQWRYGEDEFRTNYIGHILHNMEGMIMEVRERQRKEVRGRQRKAVGGARRAKSQ
jgi:ppGpp synthetase/RelA/SpoT-type nucleotidyltranferase